MPPIVETIVVAAVYLTAGESDGLARRGLIR